MEFLHHDVTALLFGAGHPALRYFARRDLLGDASSPVDDLWELPQVRRILTRQQPDGRWRYHGGNPAVRSAVDYDQLETYRQLGVLVQKYGFDRGHPAIQRAADYLGSFQTEAGDYRGIYGRQYTPNYSAAITELLIHAGYARSPQVTATVRWLRSMRQHDGGWAIPARTRGLPLNAMLTERRLLEPDRSRPSSHLVTGIVLRALAAHGSQRTSPVTRRAGDLLKSRFFTRDTYPDRAAASYWLIFSYPFWWTDLLSGLDSLTRAGYRLNDPDIARGLDWFIDHQQPNGLWNPGTNRPKDRYSDLWVALAVCRVITRCPERGIPPLRDPDAESHVGSRQSSAPAATHPVGC